VPGTKDGLKATQTKIGHWSHHRRSTR